MHVTGTPQVSPQYTADEHAVAQYVHYPMYQVVLQVELYNINPIHINSLSLQNLFVAGMFHYPLRS